MPGFAADDPRFLDSAEDLDGVLAVALEIASELWVLKDRFSVLEQLLDERGSVTREELDRYQPSGDLAARLKDDRERFLRRLALAAARRADSPEVGAP